MNLAHLLRESRDRAKQPLSRTAAEFSQESCGHPSGTHRRVVWMTETEQPSDNSGILKASGPSPDRIVVGLAVFSVDGKRLGTVKEVRGDEFLIDRPMARDYWVPFTAVVRAGPTGGAFRRGPTMDTEIVLSVSADDIYDQGWRHG